MEELLLKNQLVIMEAMVKNRFNQDKDGLIKQIKIIKEFLINIEQI